RSDRISGVFGQCERTGGVIVQEVVTGINLGDFGKDHQELNRKTEESFYDLIQALDAFGRHSTLLDFLSEPNLVDEEMIAFVSQGRHFMPHPYSLTEW
ncbi:MAG: tRNA (N(6)-L-threonylcarbamoyladenosine(37)-C(2))-methylthiotransferase MtaB, partial [Bacteroidetes bacterium]|nr:tRNA (N(6)-L-threonylcarbamoyladenosine(37)-C(2))-methylthiotransferase MtaB [Bacteroidota bacterium]